VKNVIDFEGKTMYPAESSNNMTLEKYRALEVEFHIELMKICRRYINELGIVSIIGILDVVKQETIELEGATKRDIKAEETGEENKAVNTDYPAEQEVVDKQESFR
jgi:hypothetical protein